MVSEWMGMRGWTGMGIVVGWEVGDSGGIGTMGGGTGWDGEGWMGMGNVVGSEWAWGLGR